MTFPRSPLFARIRAAAFDFVRPRPVAALGIAPAVVCFFWIFAVLIPPLQAADDPLVAVVRTVAAERGDAAEPPAPLSSAPVTPTPANIATLRPLKATANNPYLARVVAGARDYLSRPETSADWPKLTPSTAPTFFVLQAASDRDSRGTAARLEALLWLFAHPDSPLHHDPEVLKRFLRRAHAYTEGIEFTAAEGKLKAGQVLLDDFAIAPASGALREFAALYPGLLLPAQRAQWDRAMRLAADAMMGKAEGRPGNYANIDLALAVELLNFGLHLEDEKLLARSRELFTAQAANILPDGGTHYIWSQNESPGYHDVVAHFIARIYEITGDESAIAMLRRLEWYGPVSVGPRGEYWTSPSWKHTWNGGETSAGGEPIVSITGNPWVRHMVPLPSANMPLRNWEQARAGIAWWRPDIASRPLPDHYTILDRNTVGPRAWYGRFNYAATLRDIPLTEPGIATLMGAQVTGEDHARGVLLMGIYPRVYFGGDRANPRSFAWITSGLKSSLTVGREWSAFFASYQLHAFASSTKGTVVPWRGRQLWLGLPDRIVGVLDIAPESASTPSTAVEGLVRLGIGGTVMGPLQKLTSTEPGQYVFGDFKVIIHASDFAEITTEETPFRVPKAPFSDIVLRNAAPSNSPQRFVVEIRPAYVTDDAKVNVSKEPNGLIALRTEVAGKTFTLWANPTDVPIPAPLGSPSPTLSIHTSSEATAVAPGQHIVQIESPVPADHMKGWTDYEAMVSQLP